MHLLVNLKENVVISVDGQIQEEILSWECQTKLKSLRQLIPRNIFL
jgi:hypothetical protein